MRKSPRLHILLAAVLFCSIVIPTTISHSQETNTMRLSFEVATIKPSSSTAYVPGGPVGKDGYFAWNATTLKMLVWTAYFVHEWQMEWKIEGGTPGWVDSQLWDVEARARQEDVDAMPKSDPIAQSHIRMSMLQSLLEDRFKLRVERQTRQAPVYNLVVAKGGPKIKHDDGQDFPSRWQLKSGNMVTTGQSIEGRGISIERLISYLLNRVGRPVIDRTDLKGLYNIGLKWSEENSGSGDSPLVRRNLSLGPAFFTALEEQLGLRLESAKGPIEYLVIKSVQKPEGIK